MVFEDGDIIGFSGCGLVSGVINIATYGIPRWNLSHVGIICSHEGRQYLFESTTLNGNSKCAILGKPIQGVQAHYLGDILERPGKVWHYSLSCPLYNMEKKRLHMCLMEHLGQPYDVAGAVRSGGFLLRCLEKFWRREDLSTLFCSELIAHCLTRVGLTSILNASGQNPNSLVRRLSYEHVIRRRERLK